MNSVPDISDRQPVAPAPPSNRKGILFLPQTFGMLPDFGTSFLPVFKYNCFAFFLNSLPVAPAQCAVLLC